MTQTALIEPSFADVEIALGSAHDLPKQKREQWLCSLRQIAKAIGKPQTMIPARWTATRFTIDRLHHASVGSNAKTLANHKSNARAVLRWFAEKQQVPSRGAAFSNEWQSLRDKLPDTRSRAVLSSLFRYCSARKISPMAVNETVVDGYMRYRGETTALASDAAARRSIARVWNNCSETIEGWPAQRLEEPAIRGSERPAWEEFPKGMRADIDAYLTRLTRIRRNGKGRRLRPCKASTIRTRRAELVAAARAAIQNGIEIDTLTSLRALLDPKIVEIVIDAYWKADGEEPKTYTIDLGSKLLSIAREIGAFDTTELERLDDLRASLEIYRRGGLTEKNLVVIRLVMSSDVWSRVFNLPYAMMRHARILRETAPVKAAVTAQIAVAIGILCIAPVRLGNLTAILFDENLIKPDGPHSSYLLKFPYYDVKNRVDLAFPLKEKLTALIDEYLHHFRPLLMRGSNENWLFPGEAGGHKEAKSFGEQIHDRIEKALGLSITPHQFRHAAAALWLKHHPGDYETVRRVLGHRNIKTTIKFYCGLETMQANESFGDMVRGLMTFEPESTE